MKDSWVDVEVDMIPTEVEMDMSHSGAELYAFLTVVVKDIVQIVVEMGICQTVAVMDIYQIEVGFGVCQIVGAIAVVKDVHQSVVR